MQVLTDQMQSYLAGASTIRRMFEAGIEMKKRFGAENVFDFSLGNPDLPPPPAVKTALQNIAARADSPLAFGYVPNAGLPPARALLAERLSKEQSTPVGPEHVIITCGAAGGLNVILRCILEQGDEVIAPKPYFVEYGFYAGNYGGVLKAVDSEPSTFALDVDAIEAAITPRTRAIIINSPNNPSGQIYSTTELEALAAMLTRKTEAHGRPIFLLSDEPYRFLAYDGVEVPAILPLYPYSLVVGSYSKSLSLAGERLGYIVARPDMPNGADLLNGMILANRILGYVNAPVVGQHILMECIDSGVDVTVYDQRRQAMATVLEEAGITFQMPRGAFYFFPETPGGDDKAFIGRLLEHNILAVPGGGFGTPGHFRLTFCINEDTIVRSADGFKAAVKGL